MDQVLKTSTRLVSNFSLLLIQDVPASAYGPEAPKDDEATDPGPAA